MALRLEDIQKKKVVKAPEQEENKTRVLRPWESFETLGNQTRTIAAQEAVIKAKKIVESNNNLVDELRDGFVEKDVNSDLNSVLDERNKEFEFNNMDLSANIHKIKTNSGLFGRIRGFFGN